MGIKQNVHGLFRVEVLLVHLQQTSISMNNILRRPFLCFTVLCTYTHDGVTTAIKSDMFYKYIIWPGVMKFQAPENDQ